MIKSNFAPQLLKGNSLRKVSLQPIDNVEEHYGKNGDILITPTTWVIGIRETLIMGCEIGKK